MGKRWLLFAACSFTIVLISLSCISITLPAISPAKIQTSGTSTYVILTDITDPQDTYYKAIQELQQLRNGRVVTFKQTVKSAISELEAIHPRYIAVVIKPELIDELFAYDVFVSVKEIITKTGVNLSYGFLTGTTAGEVLGYLQKMQEWEHNGRAKNAVFRAYFSTLQGALGGGTGGWGDKQTQGDLKAFTSIGINSKRIDVSQVDDVAIMSDLQKAQRLYLHFLLHGNPVKLEQININKLLGLGYPSVVFNSGCYGGCIGRWYDESAPGAMDNYRNQAVPVDSGKSLPMRFLKSGCIAYFGHMRMTGSNWWVTAMTDFLAANPTATAGELVSAWYKKAGTSEQVKEKSCPRDLRGIDCNLFDFSAVILVGDPAVRIIP